MRPAGPKGILHAHRIDEAIRFEDNPLELKVPGYLTTGQTFEATVLVPQALTYLFMKLFAFRDQEAMGRELDAGQHALDFYRIVCLLTAQEYDTIRHGVAEMTFDPVVTEGARIVADSFGSETGVGVMRLRNATTPSPVPPTARPETQ